MKRLLLISICGFISLLVCGQPITPLPRATVFIAPLDAINPSFPALRLGTEVRLLPRLTVLPELVYKYTETFETQSQHELDSAVVKPLGFKLRFEMKEYFSSITLAPESVNWLWFYGAVEGFYSYNRFNDVHRPFVYTVPPDVPPLDYYGIDKRTVGGSIKIGGEAVFPTARLALDVWGGLGMKRKTVRHESRDFPFDDPDEYVLVPDPNKEGSSWVPHIALGFRLGFILLRSSIINKPKPGVLTIPGR